MRKNAKWFFELVDESASANYKSGREQRGGPTK
jgi:hypothetical protein